MRKKTSLIWTMDTKKLQDIVDNSHSISQVLRKLDYDCSTGNHRPLNDRIKHDNIDLSELLKNKKEFEKDITKRWKTIKPMEEVLVENSTYSRNALKRRLIEEKYLKYECSICTITEWEGKKIVLQLDHINGANNDNRLINLRLLCPNCHSQTPTFSGKRNKKVHICPECGKECKDKNSKVCLDCENKSRRNGKFRKVKNRPELETILTEVAEIGYCATGRKYGVSDNAIRKWIKQYKSSINSTG